MRSPIVGALFCMAAILGTVQVGWAAPAAVATTIPTNAPTVEKTPAVLPKVAAPVKKAPVLKVSGEFRHRYEQRNNFDFSYPKDDHLDLGLYRTRLGILLTPNKRLSLFVQAQDAEVNRGRLQTSAVVRDAFDLKQAYLDLKPGLLGGGKTGLKVGRQILSYGEERLVGGVEWGNPGQVFDAARLTWEKGRWSEELFVARRVLIDTIHFNNHDAWDDLWGWVGAMRSKGGNGKLETFVFYRHVHKASSQIKEATLSARWSGKPAKQLDASLEAAYQLGTSNTLDIGAYAAVAGLGYTLKAPLKPRLGVEWNYASGDTDATDNKRGTFDNLWPTNHKFYGFMDRASLQNLNNLAVHLSIKPHKKVDATASIHYLGLATARDALYDAARGVLRAATPGTTSTQVGREADFLLTVSPYSRVKVQVGYSFIDTYGFVSQTGQADHGRFFYTQTTLSL